MKAQISIDSALEVGDPTTEDAFTWAMDFHARDGPNGFESGGNRDAFTLSPIPPPYFGSGTITYAHRHTYIDR